MLSQYNIINYPLQITTFSIEEILNLFDILASGIGMVFEFN